MYNTLLFDVQHHVATVTLNRPDRYNAINNEMSFELIEALKLCRKDPEVRVIVLTGAGEKAFCSGQDLKDVAGLDTRSLGDSVAKRYSPVVRLLMQTEKPVIARVNGVAAGAGAGLALACDLTVAADTAWLVIAFINIGLVPDTGTSYTLPRLAGRQKAFELATLGDKVTAQEAHDMGLIGRVCPAADLDATVADLAKRYAEKPPVALGLVKRMLNRAATADLEQMLEMEMYCQEIAGRTEDYKEGVAAFVEKRAAVYKGK